MTAFPRSVQDWFLLITERRITDERLVLVAINELDDDEGWPSGSRGRLSGVPRERHLLNLITAIRLDQMAKENRNLGEPA